MSDTPTDDGDTVKTFRMHGPGAYSHEIAYVNVALWPNRRGASVWGGGAGIPVNRQIARWLTDNLVDQELPEEPGGNDE